MLAPVDVPLTSGHGTWFGAVFVVLILIGMGLAFYKLKTGNWPWSRK